ncbi:hypothetical protein ACI65C_003188 [Semiaphis heraclei]
MTRAFTIYGRQKQNESFLYDPPRSDTLLHTTTPPLGIGLRTDQLYLMNSRRTTYSNSVGCEYLDVVKNVVVKFKYLHSTVNSGWQ